MTTATTTKPTVVGTTLENVDVINHLLFHKAIIGEADNNRRLNDYLAMVREGEHVSMKNEFDRSIALAFDLVVANQINPWDVDLVKFSTLYLEHAREKKIDLVTAGRIILMAWTVLKLQSDDLVHRVQERKEEAEALPAWDEIPDWGLSGAELDFTQRVQMSPRAPIDEKVWHEGDRKVTLMELLEAFETARSEAENRAQFVAERDAYRARIQQEGRDKFKGRVHKEDLEADLRLVWERINSYNGGPIRLQQLYDRSDKWDYVTAFNGVLFLCRDRRIELWQENFPYGPILIRNQLAEAAATQPEGEKQ